MTDKASKRTKRTPKKESPADSLQLFLPEVADWFRASVGTPTEAQTQGWPSIQAGHNTLIVAPTGSGKTLAAFLAGLDSLWRTPIRPEGVQILYISPLKALNQDIERNLDRPLAGVSALAAERGLILPPIRIAVRTGDTPASQRQAQARKPPDVLITTPESLHLILGSKARAMLQPVRWVIVDELHALAGQKRGTFLSILLERLNQELGRDPVRIGLTATVYPLDMAAQFLGGFSPQPAPSGQSSAPGCPRPVHIVRAVMPKKWDLLVKRASVEMDPNQPRTIWPNLEKELVQLIADHRSTLIFANNRYLVERLTARINEHVQEPQVISEKVDNDALSVPDDHAEGASQAWVHAHHGSISLDRRRLTESALKEGRLKGVISTASLEMGIDMGAVDLVCQIGSPGEVARGLQRVGRAGHSVGDVSKGRFFAKTTADLLETAALVEAMGRASVEPLSIPRNCLDMLAQQVVACVAVRPWKPRLLLQMFRQSYAYQDLSEPVFEAVLEMLSGRFRVESIRDLKARIFWDRVRDELIALPGSSALALMGGGAIPDTGQYPVRLGDGGPTLGTLDEEFVLERRPGESFRLGSSSWRIDRIEPDKVIVSPSGGGDMVVMPFWRGEESRRSATLGASIGALIRQVADRSENSSTQLYLQEKCCLDEDSSRDLIRFIDRQKRVAGALPDDRTILVEAFRDPTGEVALAILSPWGGRVHQALKLVLQSRLFDQLGFRPAAQHADDGLIMRLPRDINDQPPLDLLDQLSFAEANQRLRAELADSALFGLRFRQNASRALLLPRPDPGKRTPLWLQRLRAKDLLQVVRQMPDFPIVLESYRECLTQDLDLDLLKTILDQIQAGSIRIVKRSGEAASPFAADLMNRFERKFLYEWDEPQKARNGRDRSNLADPPPSSVLDELLDPRAIDRLGQRLADAWNRPARSAEELAERIERLGELATTEVIPAHQPFLDQLAERKLCQFLKFQASSHGLWISAQELSAYLIAFPAIGPIAESRQAPIPTDLSEARWAALNHILSRFVRTRSLITANDIVQRYALEPSIAADWLAQATENGGFVRVKGDPSAGSATRWADARHMQRMLEMSLTQRRRDVRPVSPESWAAWVADQAFGKDQIQQAAQDQGPLAALALLLLPLQGWGATPREWREVILPKRLAGDPFLRLDSLLTLGEWSWKSSHPTEEPLEMPRIAFQHRDFPDFIASSFRSNSDPEKSETQIQDFLIQNGPATASEIALKLSMPMAMVRKTIQRWVRDQKVTNEKVAFLEQFFSASVSKESQPKTDPGSGAGTRPLRPMDSFRALLLQQGVGRGGHRRIGANPTTPPLSTEGRWKLIAGPGPDCIMNSARSEMQLAAWGALLMQRYGVVCREVVSFAAPGLNWPELADWLEAAEWRGEVRRGYFVEGLSGVQYTTDDTANGLLLYCDRLGAEQGGMEPSIHLISAIDPANVYGASAPLDLPLIDGGRTRLPRVSGNSIVLVNGRPVWIIQERGQRLTSLPHASQSLRQQSLRHLVRNFTGTSTKWTITMLDNAPPVTTEWAETLGQLGFVNDGLSMTMYKGLV